MTLGNVTPQHQNQNQISDRKNRDCDELDRGETTETRARNFVPGGATTGLVAVLVTTIKAWPVPLSYSQGTLEVKGEEAEHLNLQLVSGAP